MFQTVLYVIGPFLAWAGLGAGLIWASHQLVVRIIRPAGALHSKRLARAEQAVEQNRRLHDVVADISLAMEVNPQLRAGLSESTRAALYSLVTETPAAGPTSKETH